MRNGVLGTRRVPTSVYVRVFILYVHEAVGVTCRRDPQRRPRRKINTCAPSPLSLSPVVRASSASAQMADVTVLSNALGSPHSSRSCFTSFSMSDCTSVERIKGLGARVRFDHQLVKHSGGGQLGKLHRARAISMHVVHHSVGQTLQVYNVLPVDFTKIPGCCWKVARAVAFVPRSPSLS